MSDNTGNTSNSDTGNASGSGTGRIADSDSEQEQEQLRAPKMRKTNKASPTIKIVTLFSGVCYQISAKSANIVVSQHFDDKLKTLKSIDSALKLSIGELEKSQENVQKQLTELNNLMALTEEKSPYKKDTFTVQPINSDINDVITEFINGYKLMIYKAASVSNSLDKRVIYKLLAIQRVYNAQIPLLKQTKESVESAIQERQQE